MGGPRLERGRHGSLRRPWRSQVHGVDEISSLPRGLGHKGYGSASAGLEVGPLGLVGLDVVLMAQGEANVVPAIQEPLTSELIQRKLCGETNGRCFDRPASDIERDLEVGVLADGGHELC